MLAKSNLVKAAKRVKSIKYCYEMLTRAQLARVAKGS